MVVLCAAAVTQGKSLFSRQFVEMTRLRVEGLLSAFQKLVDVGRDHTFIETETVRYVYQPMESLYLVLVTNKSSNIMEDLETLRLLAKIVQDCCQTLVNEEIVLKNALDIIFAFDEVISFGHRDCVTLSQVKTFCEMDSHEEKLHQMVEQSKINEARETAKRKQMELQKIRQQEAKNPTAAGSNAAMTGFGSAENTNSSKDSGTVFGQQESMQTSHVTPVREIGGVLKEAPTWNPAMSDDSATFRPTSGPKKGMSLGKKKPADIFAGMGAAEPALADEVAAQVEPAAAPVNPLREPVAVSITEKIAADLEVEGGIDGEATCNGALEVTVLDHAKADLVCFRLAPQSQDYRYKVHPNLNKASYANNLLEARQGAFPAGGCLKWNLKTSNDDFLPITLSCWPTPTSDGTKVVIELELTDMNVSLENVLISFPATASSKPSVSNCSPGKAEPKDGRIVWFILAFDKSEPNGTLEFTANADMASLLPGSFVGTQVGTTKCPMTILECYHQERKDPIEYLCDKKTTYELKIGS